MRRVFLSFFTRAINHDHLSASRVNRSFGKLIKSLVNDLSPLIIMTLITSPLYCLPSSTRNMWPIFLFFETALVAFLSVEIFEMRIKQNYIRKRDYGKVIIESSKYSNNLVFFHLSLHRGRLIFSRNFTPRFNPSHVNFLVWRAHDSCTLFAAQFTRKCI